MYIYIVPLSLCDLFYSFVTVLVAKDGRGVNKKNE